MYVGVSAVVHTCVGPEVTVKASSTLFFEAKFPTDLGLPS